MILVDTNVISEIMRVAPSDAVVVWLNDQKSSALYVSAITIGDFEDCGIELVDPFLPRA